MSQTLTTAAAVLKEVYLPPIKEQLNQSFMLLSQLNINTEDFEGSQGVMSLHTTRNSGVGARGETDDLPTAGRQGHVKHFFPTKSVYGRIQLTGKVIRALKSDRGSFTRAVKLETEGVQRDLKRDINRQLYTPSTGVFATVTAPLSTSTFTVATKAEARYFNRGQTYQMYQGTADTSRRTFTVSSVNMSTLLVTVEVGTLPVAGDTISVTGIVPSAKAEMTGLSEIVANSGVVFGVDPATTPEWKSYSRVVGAAPTDDVLEEAIDEIWLESGENPDLAIFSVAGLRAYADGLKLLKQFPNTTKLTGGFEALSVTTGRTTLNLTAERDCGDKTGYLLNTSALELYRMSDWSWMDEDGAMLHRVPNKDAYEATLFIDQELVTGRRNTHGILTNLTV